MDITRKISDENPLFASLDESAVARLLAEGVSIKFSPGEIICMENDAPSGLYVCSSGWLKAAKISPSGREQVIRYFGPGETFNEAGAIAEAPVPATITALKESEILLIPQQRLHYLLEHEAGLASVFCKMLAERVQYLVSLVETLGLKTVEARVAEFLLLYSSRGEVPRTEWLNHGELAARLGTVPDVLGRVLRNFEKEGLIQASRHTIKLLDTEGLLIRTGTEGIL